MKRRLIIMAVAVVLLLAGGGGRGDWTARAEDVVSADVLRAVDQAVQYLTSQQKPDGSVADRQNVTAMTALSLMAMAAVGHQPTDMTPQGEVMRKALAYVLRDDRIDASGYFGQADGSRMYGHGIVALMLAEMLGMGVDEAQDVQIRDRLTRACALIVAAQEQSKQEQKNPYERGGWRYHPAAGDSDLSVTVWQVMALRAAHNAGLEIPKTAIDEAVAYITRCYKSRRGQAGELLEAARGFGYQPNDQDQYTSTAVGLLALQVCGAYDSPEVRGAATWLRGKSVTYGERFFFYGTYYYAQGMYQVGGESAELAARQVEEWLLPRQDQDGSWTARDQQEQGIGRVYSAAMAVLSLSVRHHYLPIYQR